MSQKKWVSDQPTVEVDLLSPTEWAKPQVLRALMGSTESKVFPSRDLHVLNSSPYNET